MKNGLSLKEELKERNLSLIAVRDDFHYESSASGIKPILDGLKEDRYFFKDAEIADKIIGKAAAMLFVYSGAKKIHGEVMSQSGLTVLKKYHVEYSYDTLTDVIMNRKGDDLCPMEKVVKGIEDLDEAYVKLKERSLELNK